MISQFDRVQFSLQLCIFFDDNTLYFFFLIQVLAFVGSLFAPCLALLEFSLGDLGRLWVSDGSFSVFAR